MGWLKAISTIFSVFDTVLLMLRDSKIRKQGYQEAKLEVEKRKEKNREIVDEIDNSSDVDDPWNKL
jgi:hypothetical protein